MSCGDTVTLDDEKLSAAFSEVQQLRHYLRQLVEKNGAVRARAHQELQTQWAVMSTLEKQKSHLLLTLRCLESESLTAENSIYRCKLSDLLSKQDTLEHEIKQLIEKLASVQKEITKFDKSLYQKRKDVVSMHRSKDQIMSYQRNISLLENRLHHCQSKYDDLLRSNSELQQQITLMLETQLMFDKKFKEVNKLINCGQKAIKDITHTATVAYQDSEQTKYRVLVLNERTQVDQKAVAEKIRELRFLLEKQQKLEDFQKLSSDVSSNWGSRCSLAINDKGLENKLSTYHSLLSRLRVEASVKDIKGICKQYEQLEKANSALFSKVKDMNTEIGKLSEVVKGLRVEFEITYKQYKDEKKKALASKTSVEVMFNKVGRDAYNLEEEADVHGETLESLRNAVQNLYKITDCKFADCNDKGDLSENVTDDGILEYLEVIESRMMSLIQCNKYLEYMKLKYNTKLLPCAPQPLNKNEN